MNANGKEERMKEFIGKNTKETTIKLQDKINNGLEKIILYSEGKLDEFFQEGAKLDSLSKINEQVEIANIKIDELKKILVDIDKIQCLNKQQKMYLKRITKTIINKFRILKMCCLYGSS